MVTQPKPYYTPEEYLALERAAAYKSEYLDGQIYAMSGASIPHTRITANIIRNLGNQLEGRSCWAVASDLRVQVASKSLYTYPDVVVVCDPVALADGSKDTLLNPTVIFEVLSPSTEAYDRGEKAMRYRQLASLTDYVLVAQDQVRVEHYTRRDEGWLITDVSNLANIIPLPSIGCDLPLARIYAGIAFPERTAE